MNTIKFKGNDNGMRQRMGENWQKMEYIRPHNGTQTQGTEQELAWFFIFSGLVFFAKVSVPNCGSRSSPSPGKNRAVQPLGHITSVFASCCFTLPTLEHLRAGNSLNCGRAKKTLGSEIMWSIQQEVHHSKLKTPQLPPQKNQQKNPNQLNFMHDQIKNAWM